MRFRVFSGWASIAGLALLLGSCGGTPVNPNLPAIVTQPVNQTTTVGQTATFTVTASGQGPLSYQWYEFAEPLRNATSASYTTPIVAGSDNGSFFFVVISNSIGSTESDEVTLTVNTAPTITSATKATLLVGQAGSFIVTTLSTPVSTITETGAFPAGVTFTNNSNGNATIAGTPTAAGTFPLAITAQNGISPNATQNFILTVATQPPAITSANTTTFSQDNADSFTVTATGAPIPALTETGALPTGVTFVDNGNSTATLSGEPTVLGTFAIVISAKNGINPNATQTFNLVVSATSGSLVPVRSEDVPTFHNDAARSGQNLNETILTPTNVASSTFGKIDFFPVDGAVDAQPLYLSNLAIAGKGAYNVLYVATEHGSIYAFDAATGAVLWQNTLMPPGETAASNGGCGQQSAEAGITSTPVIDRTRGPNGAIYVIAASKDAAGNSYQRFHALDAATGAELSGSPATIHASSSPAGANPSVAGTVFDPSGVQAQAGLQFLNGQIYATFAPLCGDAGGSGWVMAFSTTPPGLVGALNFAPDGSQAPISLNGAGLSADAAGNLYLFDGDTTLTGTLNAPSTGAEGSFGNAFLKLSTSTQMAVAGYSNMSGAVPTSPSAAEIDLSGALVLPDLTDASGKIWHLAVGAGRDANIYVVNRDSLNGTALNSSSIYQEIPGALSLNGVQSMPAYYNQTVYFGAVDDAIKAFSITNAMLSTAPVSQTTNVFGLTGASPAISANFTTGAILWTVDNGGNGSLLRAYDAANLTQELYNSGQASNGRDSFGAAGSFVIPVVANGRVYVATQNGVAVFGLLQ